MSLTQKLDQKGYALYKKALTKKEFLFLVEALQAQLKKAASHLALPLEDYLASVSRWADPSLIVEPGLSFLPIIQEKVCRFFPNTHPIKANIICKNQHTFGAIAYHQDISYSPQEPYEFSTWIALNDVTEEDGPLEVDIGSHKGPISPAVDFWSPLYSSHYTPKYRIPLTLQAGDMVFFDSCIWHGSGASISRSSRYALVIRWRSSSWIAPFIPPYQPLFFGMWTCHHIAHQILENTLGQKMPFHLLLSYWMEYIYNFQFSKDLNRYQIYQDLKKVFILSQAHALHNGGDATGQLYKNLWDSFLRHLPSSATYNVAKS